MTTSNEELRPIVEAALQPVRIPGAKYAFSLAANPAKVKAMLDQIDALTGALEQVIASTHSHIDGRDLLAEIHPRRTLDIKRRVDAVETWFEGDWLTGLWKSIKGARRVLNGEEFNAPLPPACIEGKITDHIAETTEAKQ